MPYAHTDAAAAESYEDVKRLLYKVSHQYANYYGAQFEDALSEAHAAFMKAFHKYKPDRQTKFSTFVCFTVSMRLSTYFRKNKKHTGGLELKEELVGTSCAELFLCDLNSELSQDARVVINLILHNSPDFALTLKWDKPCKRHKYLQTLKDFLIHDMEWTKDDVQSTFAEIRQVLFR